MLHGLILYPRATRSTDRPWRPVYPSWRRVATTYGHVVVSLHRGASTYAYGQFPWYTARKPTIGDSPLTLLSHMPTIRESVPSDHRTKRCRRGSEPIVYGSRLCNFAAVGNVAESEGYRFLGLKTRVRFSSKSFGIFFLSTLTPRKFHNQNVTPRRIKIISEMD